MILNYVYKIPSLTRNLSENSKHLTMIDLTRGINGRISLGDYCIKNMVAALENNRVCTTLKLGENLIGNDGARMLAKALKKNKTLKHLDLSYNRIGLGGLALLAKAMTNNMTLIALNLDGNPFAANPKAQSAYNAIQAALQRNRQQQALTCAA